MTTQSDFLARLQQEARLQARLHRDRVLPSQIDWLTSFIGKNSWQVILVCSGITAVILEVLKKI